MSEHKNYCTTKGLGYDFIILLFFILIVPIGVTYASVGHNDYARYCKMTPLLPCLGIKENGWTSRRFEKAFLY